MSFKESTLGMIKGQLIPEAQQEIEQGKLKSPANLDDICRRLTPALRRNISTKMMLKAAGITDGDLRQMYKEILDEVGITYEEKDGTVRTSG